MGIVIDKQTGKATRYPSARTVYTFTYRMLRCADKDALPACLFSESALNEALASWHERHEGRAYFLRLAERGAISPAERAALATYRSAV